MRGILIALLALGVLAFFVSTTGAATVTLYLTTVNASTTGGTWQLYIADSQDNDGLANYDIDVVGFGGAVVNSVPTLKAPRINDTSNQYGDAAGGNMGFNTSDSTGSNSGTGRVGIVAGQDTVYGATDDPTFDMGVLVGVGQENPIASPQNGSQGPIDGSGSPTGLTVTATSPWSYVVPGTLSLSYPIGGTLVEQGTFTTTGAFQGGLSANVDGFVEVLGTTDNGSNEIWGLPPYQQGNTPAAAILPNSYFGAPPNPEGDTIVFNPEPSGVGLLVLCLGLAASSRRLRSAYVS